MKKIKQILTEILYIMNKQQKAHCILVLIVTLIGSLLECVGVSAIVPLVSVIQNPEAMSTKYLSSISFLSDMNYTQTVLFIGVLVIILYVVKNSFFIFLSWVRIKFSCKIQREMSVKILTSYLSRGYQFFLNTNYGELSRGVSGDTSSVYNVLISSFRIISDAATILMICIFMFVADWQMALSMIMLALLCLVLIYCIFRKSMYKSGVRFREFSSKAGQALVQAFQGAKDMVLLRKQGHFIKEFERYQIETQKEQCKQTVGSESPAYIIEGICITGIMCVICIKITSLGTSENFIAVLAAFAVGAFRVLPSLGKISSSLNALTTSLPSVNALYEQVLEAEEYARKHPEAVIDIRNEEVETERADRVQFKHKLELKNITFRYNDELGDILKGINFIIKKGAAIALIGESGAGKSTLADIILGLLLPQTGSITMDDKKITDIPDAWAGIIGYVPQSVFLFDSTIKENVAFGVNEEDIDTDRVLEALERAELMDYIESLPQGINTYVGDRGIRLSGGQRQRIAIARALYHRPEILVLDEATSALDNDTESAIMSAINALQGEITLIIVAHRLTTIRKCDTIYEVVDRQLVVRDKEEVLNG